LELQGLEISEIAPFFDSLGREKELVMMTAASAMKSVFIGGIREEGELAGIVGIRKEYGLFPAEFIVVKERFWRWGIGTKLREMNIAYARRRYCLLLSSTWDIEAYRALLYSSLKLGFKKFYRREKHIYLYLPFNFKGKLLGRLLPFIYSWLPYAYEVYSGRVFRVFWNRLNIRDDDGL